MVRAFPGREADPDKPIVLSGAAGRMRWPPRGLFGGLPGSHGRIEVNGTPVPPTSSPEVAFRASDIVRLALPGGGGYGDPRRRDRELIEADLRNGYITPEAARRDHGYTGSVVEVSPFLFPGST